MEHSEHPFVPAFNPDHTDREILQAFADVCALRRAIYDGDHDESAVNQLDALMIGREKMVFGNIAISAAGIIPRLALSLVMLYPDAWIDEAIIDGNFLALFEARKRIDVPGQQLTQAIYELLTIEWDQALAKYRAQAAARKNVCKLIALLENEQARLRCEGIEESESFEQIRHHVGEMEKQASTADALRRLVRTISPDPEELQVKLEIIMTEQWDEDVAPWIARDAKFLLGRIQSEPTKPSEVTAIKQAA